MPTQSRDGGLLEPGRRLRKDDTNGRRGGPTVDKLLLTPEEAAQALGIGRTKVYELIALGEIPSVKIGASRRIPAHGLQLYVSSLTSLAS